MEYSKERKQMNKEERLERDKFYAENIKDSKAKVFYAFLEHNGVFYLDDIISGISKQHAVEDYLLSCLPALRKRLISLNSISKQVELLQRFSSKYFPFTRRFMVSYESMDYNGFRTIGLDEIMRQNFNNYLYYANTLALEHEWLIDFVITKIKNRNYKENLSEMKQAARYMLLAAAEKYTPERNVLFSTYATNWVLNALSKERREQMYIIEKVQHLEEAIRFYNKNIFKINQELKQRNLPQSKKEILNDMLEELHKKFSRSITSWNLLNPVHLSEFSDEEKVGTLESIIADPICSYNTPDIEIDREYVFGKINEALSKLDKKEEFVIRQTFGVGIKKSKTYDQIAHSLGVSKERVRQIKIKALRKLRCICLGMKLYRHIR